MKPSSDKIIKAVIDVLNRKGISGFSMRTIAKELDMKAASLYFYIKGKQEISGLICEYLCDKMEYPEKIKDAKKFLVDMGVKFRQELLKIADSAAIFGETVPETPRHLEFINKTIEGVSALGVKEDNCFSAANMLINYVLTYVLDEMYFKTIARGTSKTPGAEFYKKQTAGVNYEEQFLYGLNAVLDGFRKNTGKG